MIHESNQLDLFRRSELLEDEHVDAWTMDPVLTRLYRLRWTRGIEIVEVVGERL